MVFCMGLIYNDKCFRIDLKIALTCFHQTGNCSSTNPLLCNWPVRLLFYLMPHVTCIITPPRKVAPWVTWRLQRTLGGIEKVSALQGYGRCWPVNHSAVGDWGGWPRRPFFTGGGSPEIWLHNWWSLPRPLGHWRGRQDPHHLRRQLGPCQRPHSAEYGGKDNGADSDGLHPSHPLVERGQRGPHPSSSHWHWSGVESPSQDKRVVYTQSWRH